MSWKIGNSQQMKVLFAITLGNMLTTTTVVHAVFGTFLVPLSEEFGWSRASISTVMAIMAIASAITYPLAGRYSDKHGSRNMLLFGLVVLGLAIGALAFNPGNLIYFYFVFLVIGSFGALPSTAMFAKLVAEWFQENRGTAMGFSSGFGNGLGAVIMPIIAAILVSTQGWRAGYLGIAGIILLAGFPILFLMLRDAPKAVKQSETSKAGGHSHGYSLSHAIKMPSFWLLMGAIAAGGGIMTAILSHVVPIVGDRGFSLTTGTTAVSVFALTTAAWQTACGRLLDKVQTPRVVVPMYALSIPGLYLLEYGSSPTIVIISCVLLGITLGTQFGALPFFIARYFGLRHFGAILGVMYSAVIAAQGITPVLLDAAFDLLHSYRDAILVSMAVLAAGSLMLFLLPAYRMKVSLPEDDVLAPVH